jgi:endonuclease III
MAMNASISSFFAPRKSQQAAISKNNITFQPEDCWQRPIGLTANDAIEIVDDDTKTTELGVTKPIQTMDFNSQENRVTGDEIAVDNSSFNTVEASSLRGISPCTNRSLCENKYPKRETNNVENVLVDDESVRSARQTCSSSMIDLCSPASTQGSETKSSSPLQPNNIGTGSTDCDVAGNRADNVGEEKATNPFLKFAHDLGGLESSYFADLLKSSSAEEEMLKSQSKEATNKKSKKILSQGAIKPPAKKRKQTMVKVINNCDYSKKTDEELAECRKKWQTFADSDAPIEIRRFQVLIAARLHCQAHEGTVRKAMVLLRNHFRESSKNSSYLQGDESKSNIEQIKEKSYLSPETLCTADPEVISKMIASVLFANVKAKHIIEAAKEVKNQFNYKVPETVTSLKSITGIGPKLAGLLVHVNSYSAHEKGLQEMVKREEK